ncbi:uncharacterized protein [Gossypium hirsutum]|uniref:LINE-1 reverse transcriptase isogeny n=1 Tax=Gossypium hirsutum TaxID=3635 RepID=A0A1U8PEJ6_GOSHI|nr:uncharacterized protein LOC107957674 [Gossypium hirsutum]
MEIRGELETVLNHEELLWIQKARCDWLQFGDRNTQYFHNRTMQRRKSNRILALRISSGKWCSDQSILSVEAARFFEKLYGEIPTPMSAPPLNIFPRITDQNFDFLNKPILNDEIKKALFDMAPLKAPRSHGYHALFFQILYKLVMKVIANRFKVVFPNYITPEQAGFISGRNISDNIIIPQEDIHSMCSRKTGKKLMAIKFDLEKAYDRISWELIDVSLVVAGILEVLRKVIMGAISSSNMKIFWDGVSFQSFKPVRGIRQGCPLSPYLFIFCMEWLGHLIRSEITTRRWKLIRLSRSGPSLSHFFFADDLVIFGKVEMDQALLLKENLNQFCNFSGHKVSARKSKIYFSKCVDNSSSDQISQLFGFREEARKLSFAGRVTFAQSVLLAIPSYFMQSLLVPKGVCKEIEKISKYGRKSQLPDSIQRSNCSHLRCSLSKVWPLFCENLLWSIGDGCTIRGWKDSWIPDVGPLSSYVATHSRLDLESPLRDWVLPDNSWNVDLLSVWLPEAIIKRIVSIPPPYPTGGVDRIIWAYSDSGSFSIRSAYWTLKENSWSPIDDTWKSVWKYQGPQRVRLFLWLAAKQRLLTNSKRVRRGFGQSSVCPLCGHDSEDFYMFSAIDKEITWSCLFGIIAWRIWKNRNLFIFQNINWTAYEIIKASTSWAQHFETFLFGGKSTTSNPVTSQHCAENWVHLFSDGAVARESGNASAGGVVRDQEGNWILGYTYYLGRSSPLKAELWGILDGIHISLSKGYKKVKLQTDNIEVVRILSMEETEDFGTTLIRRIKRLLHSEGQWEIKHIPRECNLTADQLAKIRLSWKIPLQVFEAPPDLVATVIQKDQAFKAS